MGFLNTTTSMDRAEKIHEYTETDQRVVQLQQVQVEGIQTGNVDDDLPSVPGVTSPARSREKNNETADQINKSSTSSLEVEMSSSTISSPSHSSPHITKYGSRQLSISIDSGYQSTDHSVTVRLIGSRVGMGSFDLITELARVEPNLVKHIVQQLLGEEVVSFSRVSTSWQTIFEETCPKEACAVQKEEQKESDIIFKENYPKEKTDKRSVTESDCPLAVIQELGKPQYTSTPKPTTSIDIMGLHHKFYQAGQQLFMDESLTKCARLGCASPAKHLLNKQKGQCINNHCRYEFCTNCRCEFHGGMPCKVFEHRTKQRNGIGSKRSKNNLNRLGKL